MSSLTKTLLTTGAAALLLSLGTVSTVQAGPKGPQNIKNGQGLPKTVHPKHADNHKHGHGFGWGPTVMIGGGYGDGCGRYRRLFNETGNYYWMGKYYDCRY